jgi:ankyrin repeat protein
MQVAKELMEQYFQAAESGNRQELVGLLQNNPSLLNQRDEDNQNALFLAIGGGDIDCVKLLVSQGIDIHLPDHKGWTPLHEATFNGNIEMLTLLLSNGANVNARDNRGNTPLHSAARDGWDDYAQALLDHGADPLLKDNEGRNAIDWARLENKKKVIKLLKNYIGNR